MMKTTAFGTNCKAIIISHVLPYHPKKKKLSEYGDSGILHYLKEHRKATCTTLLTSGNLNAYLAEIDRQAQERVERLIEDMKQAQGITEQLKAENALEWVGRMNNIQASVIKIINSELIYK